MALCKIGLDPVHLGTENKVAGTIITFDCTLFSFVVIIIFKQSVEIKVTSMQ